eukprot:gnl/TRDRNA2_/TRDRNA2_13180_c0_seq1.p1 gnl/TRDRNA2_/TRDRNA2_13180_c0~~gnl/TRDRNA2_/TRDRNA2_13180_c0_seq1.p1  ORF type:complete len:105 (+),score=2.72 gnl/TRDRNA2_/TRDRNA2_13180_c0_seq1:133-447(+)
MMWPMLPCKFPDDNAAGVGLAMPCMLMAQTSQTYHSLPSYLRTHGSGVERTQPRTPRSLRVHLHTVCTKAAAAKASRLHQLRILSVYLHTVCINDAAARASPDK